MATNDLSNKENLVLTYLREMAQLEFPNLDLSDHGAFMEMFGTPHVKLLTPLLEFADRIKLTQSLDNASLMTEEEMDEFAAGMFFYRDTGEYATGYISLQFDDIPANGMIQIPAGTQAESKQGYRYRSLETLVYSESDLAAFYDPDSFMYKISVLFEAENPGEKYNIAENEINTILSTLPHLSDAINEIDFKGGKDKETNEELANRIKETAGTPNVGVERGWIAYAKGFTEVEDVIVAGFGHPLMKRDIIGITPEGRFSSHVDPEVHWGGKVDLHLKGKRLTEYTDGGNLETNEDGNLYIPLSKHPTYDILEIEFTSPRYTDPDLDETFFIVKDFLLIKDENPETVGTVYEKSWVLIKDDRLEEGDTVFVRYRYNALLEDMNADLFAEGNRPPTADVLLKEAKVKYIHSSMVVGLENVIGIKEKDKSAIRQRLYSYINQLPTGAELQFSDFTEPIYDSQNDSIDTKVDYISLPSHFLVTDHDNKYLYYCLSQKKKEFIAELMKESLYFAEWIPYYMDNVSIYDFFDLMHLLTYQNIEKDAWKNISLINHEWGRRVYYIEMAKRMIAYVNTIQRLSPTRWKSDENNYFELGDFSIYEDTAYTSNELTNLMDLIETIANPGTVENAEDNLLHLTVYCSVMLYVLNIDNIGGATTRDLFDWLIDLTKGTPIDYQVNH